MSSRRYVLYALLSAALLATSAARTQEMVATTADARLSISEPDNKSDSAQYAEGTRAINEARWADAVRIFKAISSEQGEHADGALYWLAYADNKLGNTSDAERVCEDLHKLYRQSRWLEECDALQVELAAKSDKPVKTDSHSKEDTRILALNSIMLNDELRATAEIKMEIDAKRSRQFKLRALDILAQGHLGVSSALLASVAHDRTNPELAAEAAQLLSRSSGDKAQAAQPAAMKLNLVVTDKQGNTVGDLKAQDFTLFDNGQPVALSEFRERGKDNAKDPAALYIVFDELNTQSATLTSARYSVMQYLKSNNGKLQLPTSLIFVNDKAVKMQDLPSFNGEFLAKSLDKHTFSLNDRATHTSYFTTFERHQASLRDFDALVIKLSQRPGRKLLVWIGPGWGVLEDLTQELSDRTRNSLFEYTVILANALREANITVYSIDPVGVGEWRTLYKEYLKPIEKPSHFNLGNQMLGVLVWESGGQVLFGNNDLGESISICVADTMHNYTLSYPMPAAAKSNELHQLKVQFKERTDLAARTTAFYYAQPQ